MESTQGCVPASRRLKAGSVKDGALFKGQEEQCGFTLIPSPVPESIPWTSSAHFKKQEPPLMYFLLVKPLTQPPHKMRKLWNSL